jgi:hypothetical protein
VVASVIVAHPRLLAITRAPGARVGVGTSDRSPCSHPAPTEADPTLGPELWGGVLVDVAKRAAIAYTQRGAGAAHESYVEIVSAMIGETQGPSEDRAPDEE